MAIGLYAFVQWSTSVLLAEFTRELAQRHVVNPKVTGVSPRWVGATIDSLSFDILRDNQRISLQLHDVDITSSIASLRLRRIDDLTVGMVEVTVHEEVNDPEQPSPKPPVSPRFSPRDMPIPSDLFVMLPVASVHLQHLKVGLPQWSLEIQSLSPVMINDTRLQTSLQLTHTQLTHAQFPDVTADITLTSSNHLGVMLASTLGTGSSPQESVALSFEGQVSGQYDALHTSVATEANIDQINGLLAMPVLHTHLASLPAFGVWKEATQGADGGVSMTLQGALPMALLASPAIDPQSILTEMFGDETFRVAVHGHMTHDVNGVDVAGSVTVDGEQGVAIRVERATVDSGYIQQHANTLLNNPIIVTRGSANMSAIFTMAPDKVVQWRPNHPDPIAWVEGQGTLAITAMDVAEEDWAIEGLKGQMRFSKQGERYALTAEALSIETLHYGIRGENVISGMSGAFSRQSGQFEVHVDKTAMDILGGHVSITPFTLQGPSLTASFDVTLEAIELAQVLALQGTEELQGEGQLAGVLPLSIQDGTVEVLGGRLSSGEIGGTDVKGRIGYARNAGAEAVAQSDPSQQVDFLLQAMEDFRYTSLHTDVSLYAPDNLFLDVGLQGANPALENGRAIHLNLNLEQNIFPLIQTLILESQLNNHLLHQYQEQYK